LQMTTSDNNPRDAEYEPTPEELAGIDRGLRAAADGRFATDQQVEAVFAKFRGALEARVRCRDRTRCQRRQA
jgi:hypothetical protein